MIERYQLLTNIALYFPSDGVGMVAYNQESRDTFFVKFPDNHILKKLLSLEVFSLSMYQEQQENQSDEAEEVISQLLQHKIIKVI